MKKILFENGKTIDGASTFNTMQDNVEDVFNGKESMGSIVVEDITCKNILEIEKSSQTSNGINKTYNTTTKKIVYSGTATSTAYLRVSYDIYLEANKTYTISTNETLPSGVSIYANNYANVGLAYADLTIASGSKSKTFTTTKAGTISFSIVVNSGTTVDLSLFVQLEKGPVATDYVEHKEFVNDYDKVMKCVFKKTVWGNALYSTGISVNAGAGGRTYLICWSTHSSTGNNTTSYIGMLRCGYSDNNYSLTEIVKSQGPTSALLVSFSVDDNGILQYRNSASAGASRVFIYQLT